MAEGISTEQPGEVTENQLEPVIGEQDGKVVSVTIPPQLIENPPLGVDPRQLQLIQAASDEGMLSKIQERRVRWMVRYYGTETTFIQLASEVGLSIGRVSKIVRRGMEDTYNLLFEKWLREKRPIHLFNESYPLDVVTNGKDSGVLLNRLGVAHIPQSKKSKRE